MEQLFIIHQFNRIDLAPAFIDACFAMMVEAKAWSWTENCGDLASALAAL